MVAFALAISGLCLGSSARADEAEDKFVAFVETLRGKVTRDDKAPGNPVVGEAFATVLGIAKGKVTDADLKELAALKSLTSLTLIGTEVMGAGLTGTEVSKSAVPGAVTGGIRGYQSASSCNLRVVEGSGTLRRNPLK